MQEFVILAKTLKAGDPPLILGNTGNVRLDPTTGGVLVHPVIGASENSSFVALPPATRNITTVTIPFINRSHSGVHVILNVTSAIGIITLQIEAFDVASQEYYPILIGSPISTSGKRVYKIMPGSSAIPFKSARDRLPATWRIVVEHDSADPVTYSVGANMLL